MASIAAAIASFSKPDQGPGGCGVVAMVDSRRFLRLHPFMVSTDPVDKRGLLIQLPHQTNQLAQMRNFVHESMKENVLHGALGLSRSRLKDNLSIQVIIRQAGD
jgi:hypothetical protein